MTNKTKLDMLQTIFGCVGTQFDFFGTKALLPMRNDRVAEVTLSQGRTHGHYMGLKVAIIHINEGPVTANIFDFDQYLGGNVDDSHHNAKYVKEMYVWENRGYDWYILRPQTTLPIMDAILNYIKTYDAK
jgi:hypothetical protein